MDCWIQIHPTTTITTEVKIINIYTNETYPCKPLRCYFTCIMVSLRWGNMFGIDRKWSNIIARLKNLNQCLWLRVKPKSNFYNEHIICSSQHYYSMCLMWKVKIILYLNTSNFKEVLIMTPENKRVKEMLPPTWCYLFGRLLVVGAQGVL